MKFFVSGIKKIKKWAIIFCNTLSVTRRFATVATFPHWGRLKLVHRQSKSEPQKFLRDAEGLALTRSRSHSDSPPDCHSLRSRRFATSSPTGYPLTLHSALCILHSALCILHSALFLSPAFFQRIPPNAISVCHPELVEIFPSEERGKIASHKAKRDLVTSFGSFLQRL